MAKIIDFYTKQVLADLESQETPGRTNAYTYPVGHHLNKKVYVICSRPDHAVQRLAVFEAEDAPIFLDDKADLIASIQRTKSDL